MIYYKSRYLSEKLNVNLAKWKRWSREFLDPDPLGGIQSGVARQFTLRDAFKVYLGGFLVSELNFSIPKALNTLKDLCPWMEDNGFFSIETQLRSSAPNKLGNHLIYIYALPQGRFGYAIRTLLTSLHAENGTNVVTENYSQSLIGCDTDPLALGQCPSAEVIAITTLYRRFRQQIA